MLTTPRLARVVIRDMSEADRITITPMETGCTVTIVWWDENRDHLIQGLADQGITATPEEHEGEWRVEFMLDSTAIEAAAQMRSICNGIEGDDWELGSPDYFYEVRDITLSMGAELDEGHVVIRVNREPLKESRALWQLYRDRVLNNARLRELGLDKVDAHDMGIGLILPNTVDLSEVMLELARCH